MVDVVLERRVINLEEMMADLIQQMKLSQQRQDQSQERIEANLRAHAERVEADLQKHREQVAADLRAHADRVEVDLQKHREQVAADLQVYRTECQAETQKLNKQLGELANRVGRMVEDLTAPSLPRILREIVACPADEEGSFAIRVRRPHLQQKKLTQEYDAVTSCGQYALFNETKSTLSSTDIDKLITKLASVRDYFPEYQNHKIIGSVATLAMDPSLVSYATRQGIVALAVGDELLDVLNEPGFTLQEF